MASNSIESLVQFFSAAISGASATCASYPFNNIRLRAIER